MNKLLFLLAVPCFGVTYAPVSGWCELGGQVTVTNGVSSTTFTQRSYKNCTVTVRDTMGNIATIFSDSTGTALGNPFNASTSGQWTFYAAVGEYSVTRSGGGIPAPFVTQYFIPSATATGTVTVVGGGNLTSGAMVTGGGSQTIQTPAASATLNASGNMSLPGTIAVTGHTIFEGVTSTGATGSGAIVYNVSPALITPNLGTPTALVLTSATALPLTTGVTGVLGLANGGTNGATQLAGFNNLSPLTTKGDIIVHNGTNNIRFGKCIDGYGYIADSGAASGLNCAIYSQISTLTANIIPKGVGTTGYTNSSITDDGTNVISGEVFKFRALSIGTTPPALVSAGGATVGFLEGTVPGTCAAATVDCLYADSTAHSFKVSLNGSGYFTIPIKVVSGTSTMATAAIGSAACATTVTTAATGTLTTDIIQWGFSSSPIGITGYAPAAAGVLTIYQWPTANNVNWSICNNTVGSITPQAITFTWTVLRP